MACSEARWDDAAVGSAGIGDGSGPITPALQPLSDEITVDQQIPSTLSNGGQDELQPSA
jgi:hypothetical protein